MRYLVLTDIHANLEALEACLADAATRGYEKRSCSAIWSATAPIRTPSSSACRRSSRPRSCAATTTRSRAGWNRPKGSTPWPRARRCGRSTPSRPRTARGSRRCRRGPLIVDDLIEICHGSPVDEDAYIFDELDALRALKVSKRPLCLFGHTHYPVTFTLSTSEAGGEVLSASNDTVFILQAGSKYL